MLKLERVGKRIGERWLVRHVTVEVAPSRVTALVGPNGSGKSTILRLLAGLWQPSEGTVWVDGKDAAGMTRRDLASRIGYVSQATHIGVPFTVREAVLMGRHPHLGRFQSPRRQDLDAVERALVRADVLHLADRPISRLSGGEQQRAVVARCLATEAKAILLDEPTASLDLEHCLEIHQLLRDLVAQGSSVVVALHDLNAVVRWADRAVVLDRGRVVAKGRPGAVLTPGTVEAVFGVDLERFRSERGVEGLVFHRPEVS